MPNKITVNEAARRWNITERSVTGFCREGRIPGAEKVGKCWMIPDDAEKPADGRIKTGAYIHSRSEKERLPLPVGVSDYRLASTEYYYVDKTLLLKDLIDERPMVTLFTRPRRFGKTLNMDMIRTFFEKTEEDTSKYFIDKKIWNCGEKYRKYQGKYPVIYITFKDVKYDTWEETYLAVTAVIREEFDRHRAAIDCSAVTANEREAFRHILDGNADKNEYAKSLAILSSILHRCTGEAAVIIVDEYDAPVQSGHSNGFFNEIIAFMRNLLSGCYKDNRHLAFGLLTGVLRVAKESIFSGLNNLAINSVLDSKYSEYFGFTSNEVKEIAAYYGATDKLNEICEWYDGYRFGQIDIFNPWSVINYFSNECEARAFWLSTGSNDIIGELIREADDDIYKNLTALVNGESFTTYIDTGVIYPEIKRNPSSIYSFLLMAGYLKVIKSAVSINGDFICEVSLPNKEISLVYRKEILQKLDKMIPQATAIEVEEAMFSGDGEKLKNVIERMLVQSVSFFDAAGENFYQGFLLGICAMFGSCYVMSSRESGEGRYDIALYPKNTGFPGIIIELKAKKCIDEKELQNLAAAALRQINEKRYDAEMRQRAVATIYKFGVAFSGKKIAVKAE